MLKFLKFSMLILFFCIYSVLPSFADYVVQRVNSGNGNTVFFDNGNYNIRKYPSPVQTPYTYTNQTKTLNGKTVYYRNPFETHTPYITEYKIEAPTVRSYSVNIPYGTYNSYYTPAVITTVRSSGPVIYTNYGRHVYPHSHTGSHIHHGCVHPCGRYMPQTGTSGGIKTRIKYF